MKPTGKKLVAPPSSLLSPQQSHFLTSNTLFFQLLCVYQGEIEDPGRHGELERSYPLKLQSAISSVVTLHIFSSKLSCRPCVKTPSISMASQQQWSHEPCSLDVSAARFNLLLCSSVFSSPLSVGLLIWVRNWSGRNVVAQQRNDTDGAPTWTQWEKSCGGTHVGACHWVAGTFWLRHLRI